MLQARYLLPEHVPVLMSLLALYLCEGYVTTDQDSITVLIDTDNCTQLFECVNLTSCEVHLGINNYSLTVLETKGDNSVEFNDSDSSLCLSSPNVKGQFSTCAKVNATVEPSTTRCLLLSPFLNGSISYFLFTIEFENSTCRLVTSRRTICDNKKTAHSVEVSASLEQTILPTSIESSKSWTFLASSSESATAMDVLNESYVATASQTSLDVTVVDRTFSADHLQSSSITDFVLESTQSLTTASTLSASSPSSVADTVLSGLGILETLHTVEVIDLSNSISDDHFLALTDSVLEPTSVMNEILTTVSLESKIPHDSSINFIESQSVHVSPSSSIVESLQINSLTFSIESTHTLDESITSTLTDFSVDDLSSFLEVTPSKEFQFLTTKSLTESISNEIISSFRDETTSLSTSFDIPMSCTASYSSTVYKLTQTESLLFSSSLYPMEDLTTATNPETVQASATMISVNSSWDTTESTYPITQRTEAITPSLMTNTFYNINISIESTHVLNGSITSPLTGFSVNDLSNEFQFLTTKSLTESISNEIISSFRDETTSLLTSFDISESSSASYSSTVYKVTQTESPLFSSSLYPMAHLTTATNPETVQASATMISVNSSWDTNESTYPITQTTEAITPSSLTNTFNNINIFVSTSTETFNSRIDTSIVVSIRDPSMPSMAVHPLATLTTSESLAPSEFTAFVEKNSNVFVFSSFTSKSTHQSMTLIGVSSTDSTSKQNNITTLDNVTSHQKVTLTTVSTNETVFYTMTTLDPNVTVHMSVFARTLRPSDDTVPIVLGVVLGSVALLMLSIFLCLYVKHRKRIQLVTRAQRYKTNGFRNWKSTKRNTSGSDQTSFDHIPLADYSPMHSKEYVGNHTKSNVDSSGTNIDKDDNPLFDNDTLQNQEDGITKAADFGKLRADVIIAGLNNNIQGKIKPRKSDALNLENIQLNDLRTQRENTKSDSNVNPLLLEKNEIKLKAIAHGKSRQSREYTDIATEVFDKGNTRPRPTSCDVYTTISEVDTGSIRYQYISLYDMARAPETEVASPELFEYYSTIATEINQRKITSNKAINQRNSELSTDRTSFNGSSLYEDINLFETKEIDSSQAEGNQDMYSILGQESRERLNPYNSLPFQNEGMNIDSEYPQYLKQVSQNTSGQVQPVYNKLFNTDVLQTDGHIYNQQQQESPSLANKSRSENVLPSSNESQKRNSDLRENEETIYFLLEPGSQYD
ncbi:flocculation protein FLO11 [Biomphalaria pfeifferi]|uniref:Flocculation protein FLO11 n=1 Tax=Biomphalaria pfeifferi TaxID=112525 RepID=A0AAD8F456_BIOPF|nr:flocculation protein FLO11 [Biomphalaria pfeifferi]